MRRPLAGREREPRRREARHAVGGVASSPPRPARAGASSARRVLGQLAGIERRPPRPCRARRPRTTSISRPSRVTVCSTVARRLAIDSARVSAPRNCARRARVGAPAPRRWRRAAGAGCGAGGRPWWRRRGCGRSAARGSARARSSRPGRKQARISAIAARRSSTARGPVVDRAERVDQHHLPVEPGEVVAEERLDHHALVGLEALLEGAPERARRAARRARQRREGERGRALEVARHQEAARRDRGEPRRARGGEIGGEGGGERRAPSPRRAARPGRSPRAGRARRAACGARAGAARGGDAPPRTSPRSPGSSAAGRAATRRDSR